MNKKLILFLFAIILISPLILSEQISQSDFVIEMYNKTIHITSNDFSGNNKDFSFDISNRSIWFIENGTNVSTQEFYVPYQKSNFSFLFVNNISVSMDLVDKYTSCLNDTSVCQLNAASNFTTCSVDKTNLQNNINNLNTQVTTLTESQKQKENQNFIWGIGGAILGIFGVLFFTGKLGKNFKEKHADEFDLHRTG